MKTLISPVVIFFFIATFTMTSCGNSKEEEKIDFSRIPPVDENEYYKVFITEDNHDSITFSIVWLLDKEDSTIIQVTDPAAAFYQSENSIMADEWIANPIVYFSSIKSIDASEAKLISTRKHPWKLALHCNGWRHNFATLIVTENDSSYIQIDNAAYIDMSYDGSVYVFDEMIENYDSGYINYTDKMILYDTTFHEIKTH